MNCSAATVVFLVVGPVVRFGKVLGHKMTLDRIIWGLGLMKIISGSTTRDKETRQTRITSRSENDKVVGRRTIWHYSNNLVLFERS